MLKETRKEIGKDLYQAETICYRIFDPVVGKFCCSGRGLYAKNGRSVWFGQGVVQNVFNGLPQEIKERAVVKQYKLVEISSDETQLSKKHCICYWEEDIPSPNHAPICPMRI